MQTAVSARVVYLGLRIFEGRGGIQCFNRCFLKAATELAPELGFSFRGLCSHDSAVKVDPRYCEPPRISTFQGKRARFALAAVRAARQADVLVVAHVNLAAVALACKLVNPRLRLLVLAYGIEIWGPQSAVGRLLLALCERVYAISHYTKRRLIEDQRVPAARIDVVPVTIDPHLPALTREGDARERLGLPATAKVILTVARLAASEAYKGYDRVIRALPQLRGQFADLRYLIVGKGDSDELERLRAIMTAAGVSDIVEFRGLASSEALVDYYAASDVFVMPSTGEGFGIVFLEAMLHGTPVIAGNRDGSVDALAGGEFGVLVDPLDVNAIARAIGDVLGKNAPAQLLDPAFLKSRVYAMFGYPAWKALLRQKLAEATAGLRRKDW